MNQSVVQLAVQSERAKRWVAMAAVIPEVHARCIPLLAHVAANRLRFPFNLAATSRSIVVNVSPQANNNRLSLNQQAGVPGLFG
jgi:hypothetical protein